MLLMTRLAREQFALGNYETALALYRKLAGELGPRPFEADIQICRKYACQQTDETPPPPDYQELLEIARDFPLSNGSAHCKKIPLDVAIVTDVPMYNYYRDVFRSLVYLTPDNYQHQIECAGFDIFLYVSHWLGIQGQEWSGAFANKKKWSALTRIVEACKAKGVPTLFQSIEDPSNYARFLPMARLCDTIFTSDLDSVQNYMHDCGHQQVYHASYGVNPLLHNPIGTCRTRWKGYFFAGSWTTKYPERCQDMEILFDAVLDSGADLTVLDRRYQQKQESYTFPRRFQDKILPPMDHKLLQSAHKLFAQNINLNSIKHSPTMGAMRVYELQAMGTPIYSNYALSTCMQSPEIRLVPCAQDLSLEQLPWNRLESERKRMAQIRHVMGDNTAYDITRSMLQKAQVSLPPEPTATVCVICSEKSEPLLANFQRQRYPDRILIHESDIRSTQAWRDLVDRHGICYFGWMTASDEYEEDYLSDLVNGFKYTKATYITKLAWFLDDLLLDNVQHEYTSVAGGKARTLFATKEWTPDRFALAHPHESIPDLPGGYAIDPFELNYLRYCERQWKGQELPQPAVTVLLPVGDNARLAQARCLASLLRNRSWPQTEVLLLTDQTADPRTRNTLAGLARIHGNVRFVPVSCLSTSNSLPQLLGEGLAASRAPALIVLHPGDELCPGGLDHLLHAWNQAEQLAAGEVVDLVAGRVVRVGRRTEIVGVDASAPLHLNMQPRAELLASGVFPQIASQALLVSRQLLLRHARRWPGPRREDSTAWGWELLCRAQHAAFSSTVCSIHYVGAQDHEESADPRVGLQRQLDATRQQLDLLQKEGLLAGYLTSAHAQAVRSRTADRLAALPADGPVHEACAAIASQLRTLLGGDPVNTAVHRSDTP